MNEPLSRTEVEQEDIEELLEEEFNPELFLRALKNALAQLENFDEDAAA